ncbi:MAG: type I-F CRISPR-associated protein Csy3 [Candidatus Accumulibacter sp. UW25]|jgi:CRISPR-associated protein Csy3
MSNVALPSFFSVSRGIQYSNGIMRAVLDDGSVMPITVREFSVRGAKSSHGDAYKLARGDAKTVKDIDTPNPQRVDSAFLPENSKRLRLSFSMNVIAVSTTRQSCNDFIYTGKVRQFLESFMEAGGFDQIARLIVWRIASAAVLWRNRYGIEKTVIVKGEGKEWRFNAEEVSSNTPDGFTAPDDLVELISGAMGDKRKVLMLSVDTEVTIGFGQEVFPSQELEMKKEQNGKSKVLYFVPDGGCETAAMHPQKIGAAIRAFDIWHPEFANAGPLSIEPMGYSHQYQKSFRTVATGTDLYAYLKAIDDLTTEIKTKGVADSRCVYLAACLMRGGVFSASLDEEEKAANAIAKKATIAERKTAKKPGKPEADAPSGFVPE